MYKADMHIVIGWVLPISSQLQITIERRVGADILVQTGGAGRPGVVMIQDCMDTEQPGTSHDF